jgi:RNA polymerase sigma-70 factor (ECF subfamily)
VARTISANRAADAASVSDTALIRAVADDDQATIAAFDARVRPRMLSFAKHQGLTRQEAEDVVQDALLAAYPQLKQGGFRGAGSVATWITGILDHHVKDALRRRYRQRRSVVQPDDLDALDGPLAYDTAEREHIQHVLLAMPARDRLVLLLNAHAGKPAREIAGLLGLGVKTTEAILTRARKQFRDLFVTSGQENGGIRRLKE